jgi:ArsR family transcriptional regulator
METYSTQAGLLKAISHPTRLAVLEILRAGEQCVCHMEAVLGLRQSHISQQLMILRKAGVVEFRRSGLNIYYRVLKPEVFTVLDAVYAAAGSPPAGPPRFKDGCPCPACSSARPIPITELKVKE